MGKRNIWKKFTKACDLMGGELKEKKLTSSCLFPNGEIGIIDTGKGIDAHIKKDNNVFTLRSKKLNIRSGSEVDLRFFDTEFYGKEGILRVNTGLWTHDKIKDVIIEDKNENVQGIFGI